MRDEALEPKSVDIERIVESILSLNPLVVVVTGGDPLFSGHLAEAVQLLSGKVGIVVDTSGYTFTPKHLELFKQHHVSVRISLDSERPKVNQAQRPLHRAYPKLARQGIPTAVAAIKTLCQCLEADLCVTVQTVATKKNANDLVTLGDKLYRLGVRSWRIFKVAPSKASYAGYMKLVGAVTDKGKRVEGKKARGPYDFAFDNVLDAYVHRWHRNMVVQIAPNETPNAVILVGPDGTFYTESTTTVAKVILDDENPKRPRLDAILNKVDYAGTCSKISQPNLPVSCHKRCITVQPVIGAPLHERPHGNGAEERKERWPWSQNPISRSSIPTPIETRHYGTNCKSTSAF